MKEAELRELALTALRSPQSPERMPPWIGDLAAGPVPNFHAHDHRRHADLIAWDNSWHLTKVGWGVLKAAAPEDRYTSKTSKKDS